MGTKAASLTNTEHSGPDIISLANSALSPPSPLPAVNFLISLAAVTYWQHGLDFILRKVPFLLGSVLMQ